ncbi:hypothetical protein ABZP36_012759 [Zizania latifolia]
MGTMRRGHRHRRPSIPQVTVRVMGWGQQTSASNRQGSFVWATMAMESSSVPPPTRRMLLGILLLLPLQGTFVPYGCGPTALPRIKEMIDADSFDALLDWDEGNTSPCSWFGVECSGEHCELLPYKLFACITRIILNMNHKNNTQYVYTRSE